jgi:hypothetical protein
MALAPIPSRLSRRRVLRFGVAAILAATAGVEPLEAQQKAAQNIVKYQQTPKGNQECDRCLQFLPPSSCKLVEGKINPKGWCLLFAPKPK